MKWRNKPLERIRGLTRAVTRYPLTVLFLVGGAWSLACSIHGGGDYSGEIFSCAVGALLSACAQAAYERFFRSRAARLLLLGGAAVLTLGYYLLVRTAPDWGEEAAVRTWVALASLFIAFLWLPSVRSPALSFNRSFMAAFKAFFHSALYAVVLFGGCALILAATDTLIAEISYRAYSYTADVTFMLFGPLLFFSLLPVYPGASAEETDPEKRELRDEAVRRAVSCPGFLSALVSYVMIPLAAVFTVILVLYIGRNITGPFWTNNLLEPLLVSFAAVVLFLLILSAELDNRFASLFRVVFPKILVPVVAVQIAASVLGAQESGVTHPRYFVILFGVFAAASGLILSLRSVRSMGAVAALFLVCTAVAVIPPLDAFSVSRRSQQAVLESALTRNGMLTAGVVTPKDDLPDDDKEKIIDSVEYLTRMGYTGKLSWLPAEFEIYEDFYETFGFLPYAQPDGSQWSVNVTLDPTLALDISGYDSLARVSVYSGELGQTFLCSYQRADGLYTLAQTGAGDAAALVLSDPQSQEIARFELGELLDRYRGYAAEKTQLSPEEATFGTENERAEMAVIVQNATVSSPAGDGESLYYDANLMVLIRFVEP